MCSGFFYFEEKIKGILYTNMPTYRKIMPNFFLHTKQKKKFHVF